MDQLANASQLNKEIQKENVIKGPKEREKKKKLSNGRRNNWFKKGKNFLFMNRLGVGIIGGKKVSKNRWEKEKVGHRNY